MFDKTNFEISFHDIMTATFILTVGIILIGITNEFDSFIIRVLLLTIGIFTVWGYQFILINRWLTNLSKE